MKIRRLEKKDKFEAYLLSSFCFHTRVDDVEKERERVENETEEDWGAFTEDGKLAARIINNKYDFYLDGTLVRTGGIGAVSTLPEYRFGGAVSEIFKELLPVAYRDGEIISTLYPFNHSFYRKQGYETLTYQNSYELTPSILEKYKTDCTVTMWHTGDSVEPFLTVYNEFVKSFNLSMPRDEKTMLEHMKYDAIYKDRKFTYLFTLANKPIAYITFTDTYHDPAAILNVEETAWLNREGFEAILSFLGRFDADYGDIDLSLPAGIDLLRIIRSRGSYNIRKTTGTSFMVRVINAEKLLGVIKKPAGCDFTIKITDEMIIENNGTWHVTSDTVSRMTGNGIIPDIEVSERSFAQMAVGGISLDEAMLKPDVRVFGNEDMLRSVFTEKKLLVTEHF